MCRLRALQRRFSSRAIPNIQYKELISTQPLILLNIKAILLVCRVVNFPLLQKLLENVGRVLSREHLAQNLYGWDDDVDSNALEAIFITCEKICNDFIRTTVALVT